MAKSKTSARDKTYSHAARVLRLRELLDTRTFVTVKELQERFGISRKTVYNDFDALREAGIPLHSEMGPDGEARWKLELAAKKKTVTLGRGQVVPLGLALRALSFLEGTEVHDQLKEIVRRLAEGATPATKEQLVQLARKVTLVPYGPKSYVDKAEVLDELLNGLLYDQRVELRYRAAGRAKAKVHRVEPLSLLLYREALYLVADSEGKDGGSKRLHFAIDRIVDASWLKGEHFAYPADYDPQQELDGAFGLVRGEREQISVLFDAEQARYVQERRWHPTQVFETQSDGRVRMTMTVSGTRDVLLWLLGHTGHFEVEAPPSLRKEVRAHLDDARKLHKGQAS